MRIFVCKTNLKARLSSLSEFTRERRPFDKGVLGPDPGAYAAWRRPPHLSSTFKMFISQLCVTVLVVSTKVPRGSNKYRHKFITLTTTNVRGAIKFPPALNLKINIQITIIIIIVIIITTIIIIMIIIINWRGSNQTVS